MRSARLASAVLALLSVRALHSEEASRPLAEEDLKGWRWRSIGPANMGGRISDVAVSEKDGTLYVAFGTGGIFRSKNGGTTFSPVFDKQPVASVGAVAVSPSNPKTVWAGTGEGNSRNSSSWGNGVYKSTDGGESWKGMGLEVTRDIARIAVDPRNDDVVYVAALGHLWGPNPERGLYRTGDGGRTWQAVLQADERTGAVDVVLDPSNPSTVYAALWARQRTPWGFTAGGTTGGIFKSTDAGKSWKKLTDGLPAEMSRVGLDIPRKNPRVVVAVVESDLGGSGGLAEVRSRAGGVFRSEDGGLHFTRVHDLAPRGFYFSKVRVDPNDDQRLYVLGFAVAVSDDGGRTFLNTVGTNIHSDCHVLWVDPASSRHLYLGTDGGFYVSWDKGETWDMVDTLATGEFYNVAYGMDTPYTLCGGLQDNGTWCGPSSTHRQSYRFDDDKKKLYGITNADWLDVHGGDGFWAAIDPTNPKLVYAESQGGNLDRVDLATGKRKSLKPRAKEGTPAYRFNWNTPVVLSHFDPSVLYVAANVLFRLTAHGDRWEAVSPDLTTADPAKMITAGSAAETYCTIVALSESPKDRNVLWAGTDDGNVQLTRDGGKTWTNVAPNVPGVEKGLWVSRLEASHFDAGRAYVSFDGHRSGVLRPTVYVTNDFGKTWTPIASGLPDGGPVKALREDPVNPDLLFAGTEFGIFVSLDRGGRWISIKGDLPTVAVDDIQIHPREHDLIAATHGRSLWVLDDISALEQAKPGALQGEATLFEPKTATEFYFRRIGGNFGNRSFRAKNPPFGAHIDYFLSNPKRGEELKVTVEDAKGRKVRELEATGLPGFNRAVWDLQREPAARLEREIGDDEGGQPRYVPPGDYTVVLSYGEKVKLKTKLRVEAEPGVHDGEVGGE